MTNRKSHLDDNPLWYKDGIIYQVHIKAYRDSTEDGVGDFQGLIEKLDYIENLGVNIIWLLPFYPSPLKDDGYDIADYLDIHSNYGKLEDFKEFLREAHKRGIRVITELVLNHTSDQHPWFKRARMSPPDSPYRNYYVWSDTTERYKDARIIFGDFEYSNWAWDPVAKSYYWHRFYSHQPDLNFDFPQVHKQLTRVVDYWLEMGVDGLRLDAVPYLYEREGTNCENLPETHEFLKKLSAHVRAKFKNKMLLAEANQWPEDAVQYFGNGDECHMAFHFPIMPRLYMAIQMEERYPIVDIIEQTPTIPENCQWAMFLRNHDELTLEMVTDEERDYMYRFYAKDNRARINLGIRRRLAPLVENDRRKIELLHILLFSFPGTPIVYYGDEIGMGDNYYLGDRDGVRTPMQWSPDRNAGFSEANPQKLFLPVIIDPEYNYETVNVEVQERVSSSLLWWMKTAIRLRKNYTAFGRGSLVFLSPANSKVLAFLRIYQDEVILVVANLSKFAQVAELDISQYADYIPVEMFSMNKFPSIKSNLHYMLTLSPYDYYWFLIQKNVSILQDSGKREIPEISLPDRVRILLDNSESAHLEEKILFDYLKHSMRFMLTGKKYQELTIVDQIVVSDNHNHKSSMLILKVTFVDIPPEYYLLTVNTATGQEVEQILNTKQSNVIAKLINNGQSIILYEGIVNNTFNYEFLKNISLKKTIKGKKGFISVSVVNRFKRLTSNINADLSLQQVNERDNNIDILYGNAFYVRMYSKLEEGLHPGIELLKFLTEKTEFINIQPYLGSLEYHNEKMQIVSLGLIRESVSSEGTAWDIFLSSVSQYFDNIKSKKKGNISHSFSFNSIFDLNIFTNSNLLCETEEKINLERVSLLGKRTGELHLALMSSDYDAAFSPEQFSLLYQRSVYQSMRTHIKSAYRYFRRHIAEDRTGFINETYSDFTAMESILVDYVRKLLHEKIVAKKIRIHGDYHLANVLFTGKDFIITNFEGPSTVALSERRLKRSPLRDVSSMIWSLYFVSMTALKKYLSINNEHIEYLKPYAEQWWLCMSNSFLKSYIEVIKDAGILPANHDLLQYMVRIYLIEKVMLELKYGLSVKAEWIDIPMEGIRFMTHDLETMVK